MCTGKRSQNAVGNRTHSHVAKNVDSQEKGQVFPYTEENKLSFSRLKKTRRLFCGDEHVRRLLR
jgi:hypothetical protein